MMTSIYRWARDVWCRCVFALRGRAWLPAYVAGRWVRRGRPECDILSVGGGVHLLREGDGWSARRKGQWFFPRFLAVRAGAPTVKGQTLIQRGASMTVDELLHEIYLAAGMDRPLYLRVEIEATRDGVRARAMQRCHDADDGTCDDVPHEMAAAEGQTLVGVLEDLRAKVAQWNA